MGIRPAGGLRCLLVNKGNVCDIFFFRGCQKFGQDILLLFRCRIKFDGRFFLGIFQLKFRPHFPKVFLDRGRCLIHQLAVIEQIQIDEQCVAGSHVQLVTAKFLESVSKAVVAGAEQNPVIHAPAFISAVAKVKGKMCIGAFLAEKQVVDICGIVKIKKFVVNTAFRCILTGRNDAGHIARNADGIKIFQDTDTLVALLDIIMIHVFVCHDRITDTFL